MLPEFPEEVILFGFMVIAAVVIVGALFLTLGSFSTKWATSHLYSNVNKNLRILKKRRANWQSTEKFKTIDSDQLNKLEFLNAETRALLKEAYRLITEFNEKIEAASSSKNTSTLRDLPLDNLEDLLMKLRKILREAPRAW